MLEIKVTGQNPLTIIVEGEIDQANKNEVVQAIRDNIDITRPQLVLDLLEASGRDDGKIDAINEAGNRTLGADGRLALVLTQEQEDKVFKKSNFTGQAEVFVFHDRQTAAKYFSERQ